MFSNHFTFTKRLFGLLLLIGGIAGGIGILLIDVINPGREGGIGPSQQIALAVMALIALVGLSLLPFGDNPA